MQGRSTHIFSLKLLLGTILSSFFHTVDNFFYTFLDPIHRFFLSKKLYWTGISSSYPAPRLIRFPVTLYLMAQLGRVTKRLKILLKFFGTCPFSNHYNHSILVMFVAIFTFQIKPVISNFWCPYLYIHMVSSNK